MTFEESGLCYTCIQTASYIMYSKTLKLEAWDITYIKEDISHTESFDYLINAAGFRTGKIDDLLGCSM